MSDYAIHMAAHRNVRDQIHNCHKCSLGSQANRVPFGGVSWAPKLILVGEAPGANEDTAGEPFVGRAGSILDQILGAGGVSRNQTLITNTVCCRPPSNRDPTPDEIETCSVNLDDQISLARTWVGLTLGKIPLNALLGKSGEPIGAHKGRPFWYKNKVWVPTYHPAYALRKKGVIPEIVNHVRQALRLYEGEDDPPRPKTSNFSIERRCLVIDHEDVKVPDKVQEITRAVFTKAEWVKIQHLSVEGLEGLIEAKQNLGVSVIK